MLKYRGLLKILNGKGYRMGCDIHPFFEKLSDEGKWYCYPFIPKLDPKYWWEPFLYSNSNKKEIEKAMVAFGINDEKIAADKLEEFCQNLPLERAEELYGDNEMVLRDWGMPYEFRSRNYEYFTLLSGVRGDSPRTLQPNNKGLPEDTCIEIYREYKATESDNHTESWVMLDELFSHSELSRIPNVQYIKSYFEDIPDLEFDRIRMVFWYDN